MTHADLVQAMREPGFYPHPVQAVEVLQTHVSSVFLTGELAYKLKKPVDFGFLDFTTPELRHRFCEKEVELNRRLAPSVYLGVEPVRVVGGRAVLGGTATSGAPAAGGEPVDWVVVMRQLDQALLGPTVLARGELTAEKIDGVVDCLVPFYREAATGPGTDEYGTAEAFKVNTDENFEQTAEFVGKALSREQYDRILGYTNGFYGDREDLFQRRIAQGRIRECHGDLHLRNIFFTDPPVIFDCIEFNERFRCSDVAADLAFLVMDLDFRGLPKLAQRVVDRYVRASGDHELVELVGFYACYRAYVRGKIACFTSRDPAVDEGAREEELSMARRYFELAFRYASEGAGRNTPTGRRMQDETIAEAAGGFGSPADSGAGPRNDGTEMNQPFLPFVEWEYPPDAVVIACGLPATNKTWSMQMVADLKDYPVLRTDALRRELLESEDLFDERVASSFEQRSRVYDEMFRRAEEIVASGSGVILDATFVTQDLRARAAEVAARHGRTLLIQENRCSEEYSLGVLRGRDKETSESNAVTEDAYFNNKRIFEVVDVEDLRRRLPRLRVVHLTVDADGEAFQDWRVVQRVEAG